MPAMTEEQVYEQLTRDGDSLGAIRKNTEMLRQHFMTESQRVIHTLSQLDPHNKDLHAAEAERIYQENNAVLSRVLMEIASTTPQKMPLLKEVIEDASTATKISKSQAKAVLTFPFVLFFAFPAALVYAIGFLSIPILIGLVAVVVNAFTLRIALSGVINSIAAIGFWTIFKVTYWLSYILAVFNGVSQVRSGGSFSDVYEELFVKPMQAIANIVDGYVNASKK